MDNLFALAFTLSFALFLIGIVSPKTSLFWDKKIRTRKRSATLYGPLAIIFFVLFGTTNDKTKIEKTLDAEPQAYTVATTVQSKPQLTQAELDSITKIEKERELEEIKKNKERELEEIKKNTITAPDLMAAYEANEVNADQNFKGKTFYVTGRITDIKKDILDHIYVTLEGDEMFREVQCFFNDVETASQLRKGMKVTFRGTCDGLMMNVLMKHCVLVENN